MELNIEKEKNDTGEAGEVWRLGFVGNGKDFTFFQTRWESTWKIYDLHVNTIIFIALWVIHGKECYIKST
jgi:hypothetical protein